jgi:hypothetical protein
MTENEIFTIMQKVAVEISYIDNIHIRELFMMLFATEFGLDISLCRYCVEKERESRLDKRKRRG